MTAHQRRSIRVFIASLLITVFPLVTLWNSASAHQPARVTRTASGSARQQEIVRIVQEIDPRNIERTIRKLVSFGTRNTLSTQTDPNRGIAAARDWLFSEFSKAAEQSGGRMTVEKQTFEQAKAARVPQPTMLTNILATLRGTEPESAGRTYIVSGHYDSMCMSPTDSTCDAPGANDDASGTAAVLEMARVMAKYKFDATIIFMTVAGEEQGLLGSTYAAEQALQKHVDVEAMFTNDIIGSSLGGNGVRDQHTVRVFSEGVPSSEKPEEATVRRGVGGENDSAARQLAIATCAAAIIFRLSSAVLRPLDLPNQMKTIATSTRMCGLKTVCSMATCRNTMISISLPTLLA
jgi:hypothetical protein